jgi:hypothetical protein
MIRERADGKGDHRIRPKRASANSLSSPRFHEGARIQPDPIERGEHTVLVFAGGPDNDSSMLVGAEDAPRCPRCGFALDHAWINPRFTLTEKQ